MFNNYKKIPTDYVRAYYLDWNGNSTTWTNNATVTNWTWIKSDKLYQAQCLSWGASTYLTYASVTYTNSYIWIYASWVWTFTKNSTKVTATALNWVNGERYAWLKFFNRTLTSEEERALELEWQRQLGNWWSYPWLLSGLVGYFRAEDVWWTALYNLVNWITATRVGWTNTADNLWNTKAISNPNYTWSSLTYTTWYTFENSWSGWNIVTSPTWLSATWINRTTTLRDIFLFNRTLSANEVIQLQDLCNKEIIYPSKVYDLPNLRDWLVLDLDSNWKDLSWNWNNWTLINSPSLVRQWRAKGLSYNGSNQYITIPDSSMLDTWLQNFTFSMWIKTNWTALYKIISKNSTSWYNWWNLYLNDWWSWRVTFSIYDWVVREAKTSSIPMNDWIWRMLTITWNWNIIKLYKDWKEATSYTSQTNSTWTMPNTDRPIIVWYDMWSNLYYYNWIIDNPRIRNRVLSQAEIQQLYYKDKANFCY